MFHLFAPYKLALAYKRLRCLVHSMCVAGCIHGIHTKCCRCIAVVECNWQFQRQSTLRGTLVVAMRLRQHSSFGHEPIVPPAILVWSIISEVLLMLVLMLLMTNVYVVDDDDDDDDDVDDDDDCLFVCLFNKCLT